MRADIVLGLHYGDEGKGQTVFNLCKGYKSQDMSTCVVRFSGGNQVGHTVVTSVKDSIRRHVHSNFGSGALIGVPTYYTEHCVVNPITLAVEAEVIKQKTSTLTVPLVVFHPHAKVATPIDMMLNKKSRSMEHGSCGMGIYHTLKRNEEGLYTLYARDLYSPNVLSIKLELISKYYANLPDFDWKPFLNAVESLKRYVKVENYTYLKKFERLVFEGSQGIMLDRRFGFGVHKTYSYTSSKNTWGIIKDSHVAGTDIHYVTRSYVTRHGNGPFPLEDNELKFEDNTNIENDAQGILRFGKLNLSFIRHSMTMDQGDHPSLEVISSNLVITHTDQYPISYSLNLLKSVLPNLDTARIQVFEDIKLL